MQNYHIYVINIMLTEKDLKQIAERGISEKQVEAQLKQIAEGFPFLKLEAAASTERVFLLLRMMRRLKISRLGITTRPKVTR